MRIKEWRTEEWEMVESDLDRSAEIIQSEQQQKIIFKKIIIISSYWGTISKGILCELHFYYRSSRKRWKGSMQNKHLKN